MLVELKLKFELNWKTETDCDQYDVIVKNLNNAHSNIMALQKVISWSWSWISKSWIQVCQRLSLLDIMKFVVGEY